MLWIEELVNNLIQWEIASIANRTKYFTNNSNIENWFRVPPSCSTVTDRVRVLKKCIVPLFSVQSNYLWAVSEMVCCENERKNVKKKKPKEGTYGAREILYTWQNATYGQNSDINERRRRSKAHTHNVFGFFFISSVVGICEMCTQRQRGIRSSSEQQRRPSISRWTMSFNIQTNEKKTSVRAHKQRTHTHTRLGVVVCSISRTVGASVSI